jgi:uncharacterized membrane protein YedE/YeeE
MKVLKYLLVGFVFESYWQNRKQFGNRIYEMFQFQSFHMYGIIMVAIGTGWLEPDYKRKKNNGHQRNAHWNSGQRNGLISLLIGGLIFGLGWALVGSCPGPIFILLELASECSYCVFGAPSGLIYMEFEG